MPPRSIASPPAAMGNTGSATNPASRPALTNPQLVQKAASIAEMRIGGTGRVQGIRKHTYAKNLLERYQRAYGDRGLELESSWYNGNPKKYGYPGSVRIDVLDINKGIAYDYKFTHNLNYTMPQSRVNAIKFHSGVSSVEVIFP